MTEREVTSIILKRLDRQEDSSEKRHSELLARISSLERKVDLTNGRVLGLEQREKANNSRVGSLEAGLQSHVVDVDEKMVERRFLSQTRREWVELFVRSVLPNGLTATLLFALFKVFG